MPIHISIYTLCEKNIKTIALIFLIFDFAFAQMNNI